jgi:hypothetical protein
MCLIARTPFRDGGKPLKHSLKPFCWIPMPIIAKNHSYKICIILQTRMKSKYLIYTKFSEFIVTCTLLTLWIWNMDSTYNQRIWKEEIGSNGDVDKEVNDDEHHLVGLRQNELKTQESRQWKKKKKKKKLMTTILKRKHKGILVVVFVSWTEGDQTCVFPMTLDL